MDRTKKRTGYCILLLIFAIGILITGCSSADPEAAASTIASNEQDLPAILKRGKIRVLAENSSVSFFIYKGKRMGFEYEILREFADDIGVELEIISVSDLNDINQQLNSNEGDIIACNYSITRDRQDEIAFSRPFFQTNQVLVQRKRDTLQQLSASAWKKYNITDPLQLGKKRIDVWKESSYYSRLINLQDEIGDTIYIRPTHGSQSVEELIEMVSDGQIDYTVAEKNIAQINQGFYDNLDISLAISFKQNIAFGLSRNAPLLKKRLDQWLTKFMQKETFAFIRRKYYEPASQVENTAVNSGPLKKGELSRFDAIMRTEAAKYGFDWRLLAAIIYHESKFNPKAHAFGGAYGLMQFMPGTGPKFGVYPNSTPEAQIRGGMKYIAKIKNLWGDIPNAEEQNKFILASYNVGSGHIKDAQRLASKHGLDPKIWDNNVEKMTQNLGKHEYYTDPIVTSGAFRGNFTCRYVKEIIAQYNTYKTLY